MPWPEAPAPVRMERVALVAPQDALRGMLVRVADAGVVELDRDDRPSPPGRQEAEHRLRNVGATAEALLSPDEPDLEELERRRRADLLAGEAQLREHASRAVRRHRVAALTGWCPSKEVPGLARRLAPLGCSVVPLPPPHGVDPPTLLRGGKTVRRSFTPLVNTFGTVAYADVDPTVLAGIAYVAMFGMMFGDAGHGALLIAFAAFLRTGRPVSLPRLHPLWPFVGGAGLTATLFGFLYGEFFGPTGVLPVLWLAPLESPVTLLAAAMAVGAVLLALAYAVGTVNRWREGGVRLALYSPSGVAGTALFLGLAGVASGALLFGGPLLAAGLAVMAAGLALAAVGLFADSGGGAAGVAQTVVRLSDLLLRLGANLVSFARLAAFGMMHAALGWVVWQGTVALAGRGWAGVIAAAAVFTVGNAVAFALEALVAGVQALRLEFYELFSRVFDVEGRPFRPWHMPTSAQEEP